MTSSPRREPITPVILSGGSGTRLWPFSRPEMPKQFLALDGTETMLQATVNRVPVSAGFAAPIVVAAQGHAALVTAQLSAIGVDAASVILEPVARNTAPAIALAALAVEGDPILLVMPSDHVIRDVAAFHAAIGRARDLADDGWLVTFGITPDSPQTGYGWIEIGAPLGEGTFRVNRFLEKPSRERADAMLAAGGHAWNGGIFLFRASAYLSALDAHAPDVADAARRAMAVPRTDGALLHPDAHAIASAPSISIDYAVMEKAPQVAVVPVGMEWSDVGSWDALHGISACDDAGNVCRGDVVAIDSRDCLVLAGGARVAVLGVEGLAVIVDGDDILILPRARSQDVKRVTDAVADRPARSSPTG